ncbi:hypothetical protein LPA44_12960 [Halobacterium sp. KA-4]|uniref:hypothetical protein n=1 Tax=Halobacterium sp. KA-4 TaxID=2896367 RepID=UPI001E5319B1|nr:hypothetical protein [Halobacterium sp. KA-4]MCD2200799.1 hypothetical protein [Halobacterium sp. KA-4]
MNNLYLAPVGPEWIDQFNKTVDNRVPVPEDAPDDLQREDKIRLWGTGDGPQKRSFFEDMSSGDVVLFYNNGEFIASGRIGTPFESDAVGEAAWGEPESSFLFTITDYKRITLDRRRIGRLLGYSEGWYPRGFVEVSNDARNTLLQEYNSIEEAFQDFQTEEDGGEKKPSKPDDDTDTPREHTEIQYYLVQLGLRHGYDVYVAKNDKNREYDGERLGENCVESLQLPGFSSAATDIIKYVDVIWLEDDHIAKLFEVESTTSIYSGILRMADFAVKVPNIAIDIRIVAPGNDEDKVRKEMTRPTFDKVLGNAEHCDLGFLSFDDVQETYETVQDAGPLQNVF